MSCCFVTSGGLGGESPAPSEDEAASERDDTTDGLSPPPPPQPPPPPLPPGDIRSACVELGDESTVVSLECCSISATPSIAAVNTHTQPITRATPPTVRDAIAETSGRIGHNFSGRNTRQHRVHPQLTAATMFASGPRAQRIAHPALACPVQPRQWSTTVRPTALPCSSPPKGTLRSCQLPRERNYWPDPSPRLELNACRRCWGKVPSACRHRAPSHALVGLVH
ncbi:Hypothetical predicted protein [Cloeon dipterum]|uniref:Uncharacterized protein n=1 Tax=Cloeon dipterum TaxID=197152 RepID=A0A8S1DWS4_9INSE|nr:Hypothetical predicted protein [Cloeon dipterum]